MACHFIAIVILELVKGNNQNARQHFGFASWNCRQET
jgi:hypothetical protein